LHVSVQVDEGTNHPVAVLSMPHRKVGWVVLLGPPGQRYASSWSPTSLAWKLPGAPLARVKLALRSTVPAGTSRPLPLILGRNMRWGSFGFRANGPVGESHVSSVTYSVSV
jgi:hypothetical protein